MDYLKDKTFWNWIDTHISYDPNDLALRYAHKNEWIDFAILQVHCRQKSAKKLEETLHHSRFVFPTLLSSEQSTSDSIANFHASLVNGGSVVLDMTCGLGIDSFHIAQNASSVLAIDINPDVIRAANHNAKVLDINNMGFVCCDSEYYVKQTNRHFDAVFIDPSRRSSDNKRLFALEDCQPNVVTLMPRLLEISDRILVKMSPMLDVTSVFNGLPDITDIYAVGTTSECKEIVAIVESRRCHTPSDVSYHAVTICPDRGKSDFSFSKSDESSAKVSFVSEVNDGFLYVPYPSTAKLMPHKLLSDRFGLLKLHNNSHLYYSEEFKDCFPCEIFRIKEILPFNKTTIRSLKAKYPKINISTRNFPLSPQELQSRLKTKDGGDFYLFATTIFDSSKVLIITSKSEC